MLHDKLRALRASRSIPDALFDVAHRLRLVGNLASHDSTHALPPRVELLDLVSSLRREMLLCSSAQGQP